MKTCGYVMLVLLAMLVLYLLGLCIVLDQRQTRFDATKAEGYSADIASGLIDPTVYAAAGRDVRFEVLVWNIGSAVWEPNGTTGLGLFEQKSKDVWMGRDGHGNEPQWRFKPKGIMRADGNSEVFTVTFKAPTKPGVYHMRLQMVDERVDDKGQPIVGRWFGSIVKFDVIVPEAAVAAASG